MGSTQQEYNEQRGRDRRLDEGLAQSPPTPALRVPVVIAYAHHSHPASARAVSDLVPLLLSWKNVLTNGR